MEAPPVGEMYQDLRDRILEDPTADPQTYLEYANWMVGYAKGQVPDVGTGPVCQNELVQYVVMCGRGPPKPCETLEGVPPCGPLNYCALYEEVCNFDRCRMVPASCGPVNPCAYLRGCEPCEFAPCDHPCNSPEQCADPCRYVNLPVACGDDDVEVCEIYEVYGYCRDPPTDHCTLPFVGTYVCDGNVPMPCDSPLLRDTQVCAPLPPLGVPIWPDGDEMGLLSNGPQCPGVPIHEQPSGDSQFSIWAVYDHLGGNIGAARPTTYMYVSWSLTSNTLATGADGYVFGAVLQHTGERWGVTTLKNAKSEFAQAGCLPMGYFEGFVTEVDFIVQGGSWGVATASSRSVTVSASIDVGKVILNVVSRSPDWSDVVELGGSIEFENTTVFDSELILSSADTARFP